MATAKKQLAAVKNAAVKNAAVKAAAPRRAPRPAPKPAQTNALTVDPRTVARRPAVPFGQTIGNLLGRPGLDSRPSLVGMPGSGLTQVTDPAMLEDIRQKVAAQQAADQAALDGRQFPSLVGRPGLDSRPSLVGMPDRGMPGFGGDPRFPSLVSPVPRTPPPPIPDIGMPGFGGRPQLPPQFQDAYNAQEKLKQMEMATMQPYQQRAEAAMNANPAYRQLQQLSQQLGPNASPQQLQQLQQLKLQLDGDPAFNEARQQAQQANMEFQQNYAQPFQQQYGQQLAQLQQYDRLQNAQGGYDAYMQDFMRKSAANSMDMSKPAISPMNFEGFQRSFPTGYAAGSIFGGPSGPGSAGPMQQPYNPYQQPSVRPQIMGGPASKMGPQNPQTGMPRPQQRPMPRNYGGYNSIQGMGSNQYGGFNAPPPGMGGGQMGMGQMAQQQPQTQNNMFGSFGGFGQAMGGGQNQGPNQQAQQEDQYGNFGGGNNEVGGGGGGGGGGGLF